VIVPSETSADAVKLPPLKTVTDVAEVISGQHIEAKDYNTERRGIGYLTGPSDFGDLTPLVTKWTEHPKRFAIAGDTLVTVKGSGIGSVNFMQEERLCISRQLIALRPSGVDPLYLFWFLSSQFAVLQARGSGAAIPGLSREDVAGLRLHVPPLPEQRRIVAILDEAFEGIAAAKANAEKNLRNARELFESRLADLFCTGKGSWTIARLGDVCGFQGGSQPPKSKFQYTPAKSLVRFLQIRDFASDKNLTFIPESAKNRLCEADDIMLGRYGASVGKVLTGLAGAYNVALIKTIPDESRISRRYLYHYLTSPAFQSPLRQVAARSAQDGFSREDISGFAIPLPPLPEQSAVVESLDAVEAECDRLGQQYDTGTTALDELKASFLHQAFTGQL